MSLLTLRLVLNKSGSGFDREESRILNRNLPDSCYGNDINETSDYLKTALACQNRPQVLTFLRFLNIKKERSNIILSKLKKLDSDPRYTNIQRFDIFSLREMHNIVASKMIESDSFISESDRGAALLATYELLRMSEVIGSAKVSVSFWGSRKVSFLNLLYGDMTLDQLAQEILKVAKKRCLAVDMSREERLKGVGMADVVKKLYKDSDRIAKLNLFTRFVIWLRELTFSPQTTPRFQVEGGEVNRYFMGIPKWNSKEHFLVTKVKRDSSGSLTKTFRRR